MALQKTITNAKGQVTEYHRIDKVTQVYMADQPWIDINIASYASEDYRTEEKEGSTDKVLDTMFFSLPFGTTEDFIRATLYSRLKAEITEFADATDC